MDIQSAKREFYLKVADIIRQNPTMGYRRLMVTYGLSYHAILCAIKQENIARPKGRKTHVKEEA